MTWTDAADFFARDEELYERKYGPINMGTLIEDMRKEPAKADYRKKQRAKHKAEAAQANPAEGAE